MTILAGGIALCHHKQSVSSFRVYWPILSIG